MPIPMYSTTSISAWLKLSRGTAHGADRVRVRCVNHMEIRLSYGIEAQGSAQISRKATLVDRR